MYASDCRAGKNVMSRYLGLPGPQERFRMCNGSLAPFTGTTSHCNNLSTAAVPRRSGSQGLASFECLLCHAQWLHVLQYVTDADTISRKVWEGCGAKRSTTSSVSCASSTNKDPARPGSLSMLSLARAPSFSVLPCMT